MSEQEPGNTSATPLSATHLRARTHGPNRTLALALIAVAVIFLATAFGVAALVAYGPY